MSGVDPWGDGDVSRSHLWKETVSQRQSPQEKRAPLRFPSVKGDLLMGSSKETCCSVFRSNLGVSELRGEGVCVTFNNGIRAQLMQGTLKLSTMAIEVL